MGQWSYQKYKGNDIIYQCYLHLVHSTRWLP